MESCLLRSQQNPFALCLHRDECGNCPWQTREVAPCEDAGAHVHTTISTQAHLLTMQRLQGTCIKYMHLPGARCVQQ